jgi:hypothetical protein
MSKDPIAPVLAYKHYPALERRLHKIMQYVLECLDKTPGGTESVIMNEFHNPSIPVQPVPVEDEKTKEEDDVVPHQPPDGQDHVLIPPADHREEAEIQKQAIPLAA